MLQGLGWRAGRLRGQFRYCSVRLGVHASCRHVSFRASARGLAAIVPQKNPCRRSVGVEAAMVAGRARSGAADLAVNSILRD